MMTKRGLADETVRARRRRAVTGTRTLAILACTLVLTGAEGAPHAAPVLTASAPAYAGNIARAPRVAGNVPAAAPTASAPAASPAPAAPYPYPPGAPLPAPYTYPSSGPTPPYYQAPSYPPPPPGNPAYLPYYPHASYSAYPPSPAEMDPSSRERLRPGFHAHDGFYLHLGVGILYGHNTIGNTGTRVEANGTGVGITASLGGAVARNVILCARVHLSNVETHFVDLGSGYDERAATFHSGLLGGGLVYYLEDTNVFFAGTLGLAVFDVEGRYNTRLADTKGRFGAAFEVGKEWWVSRNWGIGAALKGTYGSAKEIASNDAVWTTLGLALLFSATFN